MGEQFIVMEPAAEGRSGESAAERKTMLIYAAPQNDAKCGSCGKEITWVMTAPRCAYMPMNRGFEVIEREGSTQLRLRVYCDQSHFSTCPNAKWHRKGGGK